ncbi:hypothetical protein BDB01DRAFT_570237 [Pilobolus umbonatus]|nr:hypothetical protein BDB01DRAFT_570237 [Pilobolus umbonatus]
MLPEQDTSLDTQQWNIFSPWNKLPSIRTVDDNYCKVCKKKFNNIITFNQHLKSGKHLANEKKNKPSPQLKEAQQHLVSAKTMDTVSAVQTFWTLSQFFFDQRRPADTRSALIALQERVVSPGLTPGQITAYLYNSQLALARLYYLYNHITQSQELYLSAIEHKWKLNQHVLIEISKNTSLSMTDLIHHCDQLATKYLSRERARTSGGTKHTISTVLYEVGNVFSQSTLYHAIPCYQIAVIVYVTGSLVAAYDGADPIMFYTQLERVFDALDWTHRSIELKLMTGDRWDQFVALVMCLERDDLVRASTIANELHELKEYPDVQVKKQHTFSYKSCFHSILFSS